MKAKCFLSCLLFICKCHINLGMKMWICPQLLSLPLSCLHLVSSEWNPVCFLRRLAWTSQMKREVLGLGPFEMWLHSCMVICFCVQDFELISSQKVCIPKSKRHLGMFSLKPFNLRSLWLPQFQYRNLGIFAVN